MTALDRPPTPFEVMQDALDAYVERTLRKFLAAGRLQKDAAAYLGIDTVKACTYAAKFGIKFPHASVHRIGRRPRARVAIEQTQQYPGRVGDRDGVLPRPTKRRCADCPATFMTTHLDVIRCPNCRRRQSAPGSRP